MPLCAAPVVTSAHTTYKARCEIPRRSRNLANASAREAVCFKNVVPGSISHRELSSSRFQNSLCKLCKGVPRGSSGITCGTSVAEAVHTTPSQSRSELMISLEDRTLKQKFTTRWYEVGADGKARLETIGNYMQETGANHVDALYKSDDGLASSPLMKKDRLVWIFAKMYIEMDAYPRWRDVVLVESWMQPSGRNGGRRDWTFTDSATGAQLGHATSLWVMFNLDTRRLARVPPAVREEYASYCVEEPRSAVAEQEAMNQRLPQGEGPSIRTAKDLRARYCDLDLHDHVNNVTYTSWLLEAIDRSLWQSHELCSITIEFRQECILEDVVESVAWEEQQVTDSSNGNGKAVGQEGELSFLHTLYIQNSKGELARGRTRWRLRKE